MTNQSCLHRVEVNIPCYHKQRFRRFDGLVAVSPLKKMPDIPIFQINSLRFAIDVSTEFIKCRIDPPSVCTRTK